MKKIILIIFATIITSCLAQEKKETFYENGNKKRVHFVKEDNSPQGEDVSYYRNGQIKKVTLWDSGRLVDSIVRYDFSGNLISTGYIKNDSLTFFQSNGVKEFEVALKNGRENGTAIYYNSSEKIVGYSLFKDGLKNGMSVILNEKTMTPTYISDYKNGKVGGLIVAFYDNGQMKSMRVKNVESFEGQVFKFYNNGVIKSIVKTKKGKAEGWRYSYDSSGKLINKTLYSKGQKIQAIVN